MVVVPAATPVTTPVLLIVATEGTWLLQTPPDVVLDNVIRLLTQTDDGPVMLDNVGVVATVIAVVALADPQAFAIV